MAESGSKIGTLSEGPLHADLKEWYRQPEDLIEHEVEGFVADIFRGGCVIEIQTRGFSKMRRKLDRLLDQFPITIVHPIAAVKWIRRIDAVGEVVSRRRSPKRGRLCDVFEELTSFPTLLSHPNFALELVLIELEEVRQDDPSHWRRGWSLVERRLVQVSEAHRLDRPSDLMSLLPEELTEPFTTGDIAEQLKVRRRLAQAIAYCLREARVIDVVERTRAGLLYQTARP